MKYFILLHDMNEKKNINAKISNLTVILIEQCNLIKIQKMFRPNFVNPWNQTQILSKTSRFSIFDFFKQFVFESEISGKEKKKDYMLKIFNATYVFKIFAAARL